MSNSKVYAIPFVVNDSEDVFGVANENALFVFIGSYEECCDFLDIQTKANNITYQIPCYEFYDKLYGNN